MQQQHYNGSVHRALCKVMKKRPPSIQRDIGLAHYKMHVIESLIQYHAFVLVGLFPATKLIKKEDPKILFQIL